MKPVEPVNLAAEAWNRLLSMPEEEYKKTLKDIDALRHLVTDKLLSPMDVTRALIEVILK